MGLHIGAQRPANCSDQGFKCFATHLSWDQQPHNFPKFWSSARKVFVVMQKQYWWWCVAYTATTHQQLCQMLVTVI